MKFWVAGRTLLASNNVKEVENSAFCTNVSPPQRGGAVPAPLSERWVEMVRQLPRGVRPSGRPQSSVKVPRTRRQRRNLFGLRVKLPPVTTSLTTHKVEVILLSALPKDATRKFAGLSSHYSFFMLNVK